MATPSNGIQIDDKPTETVINGHVKPESSTEDILVVGSLGSAKDSSYMTVISSLQGNIDKYLIDRIVEGAVNLLPSRYHKAYVVLTSEEYESSSDTLRQLFNFIAQSLVPAGELYVEGVSPNSNIRQQISQSGLEVDAEGAFSTRLVARKPAALSVALPKRSTKSQKAAIWSFAAPSTPTIDPTSLLQPSDLERPVPKCEPITPGAPRRKKACKGCTCGLAELEAEEAKSRKVVMLSAQVDGEAVVVGQDEKERLIQAAKMANKATSSCGSCFLGDAFRCASCPYLGLPAFKPGEKVEIDFGMDDV